MCAQNHCDVHLIKMILETAQMLSTAHIVLDNNVVAYKKTHENHPCAVWMRETSENYAWSVLFLTELLAEYTFRFGKVHATSRHLKALAVVPKAIRFGKRTEFARAMPEYLKTLGVIDAYKALLRRKLRNWKARENPVRVIFTRRCVPDFLEGIAEHKIQVVRAGKVMKSNPASLESGELNLYLRRLRKRDRLAGQWQDHKRTMRSRSLLHLPHFEVA